MRRPKGTVLILSLILLTAFTTLGIATLSGASIEKKIGHNFNQLEMAKQAAFSVIKEGQIWLDTLVIKPTAYRSGILRQQGSVDSAFTDASWWIRNGISSNQTYVLGANRAKYVIEQLHLDETTHAQLYRIIGIGYSKNSAIYHIAQQIYRLPYARIRYQADYYAYIFTNTGWGCSSQNNWRTLNTCELVNVTKDTRFTIYVRARNFNRPYGFLASINWQGKTYYTNGNSFSASNVADVETASGTWNANNVSGYLQEAQWLWGPSGWLISSWTPGEYHDYTGNTGAPP